jgi:hypothetical protein
VFCKSIAGFRVTGCNEAAAVKGLGRVGRIAIGAVIALLLTLATYSSARELSQKELAALIMILSNGGMMLEEDPGTGGEDGGEEPEDPGIDPLAFFSENLASVVAGRCAACHVGANGLAGSSGARLLFVSGQDAVNVDAIRAYVELLDDGGATLLRKIRGVGHGGLEQFAAGTQGYIDFETLLDAINGSATTNEDVAGAGFFEGVALAGPEQTLRRAALILGGRLPTDEEIQLAKTDEAGLRQAVLGVMNGDGFHEFLVRGANDRLHTDGFLNNLFLEVLDLNITQQYPIGAAMYFLAPGYTQQQDEARWDLVRRVQFGAVRAPLELIAHVVENDLPYTEILTADYTMVNPDTAQIYRTGTNFSPGDDFRTFRTGVNQGLVLVDDQHESRFIQDSGMQIIRHGPYMRYPHAGILNEPAWLNRYPSTETNRNRARSRWTYYHFLGFDIEKSAPRTTDPVALADTNNPTLNNPACTACHERLDPVAGAYQNYGNEGLFRSSYGGEDALPDTYKYPEWFGGEADSSPYQDGDTWYRDMRNPGFDGGQQPANRVDDSLAWLGQQIVADPRFASATVSFWWPALMGSKVLAIPEVPSDPNYDQLINAFEAQRGDIQSMSQRFSGGSFNLKQLLADMVMSPWFRAKTITQNPGDARVAELASVGVDRLLTPEELERKTEAIFGYAWDKSPADWETTDGFYSALRDRFRIYYGGIDSVGIKERSTAMTALMANVAERQAAELACGAVSLEFLEAPQDRRLFTEVDANTTPLSEGSTTLDVAIRSYAQRRNYDLQASLNAGTRQLRISFNNDGYNNVTGQDRNLYIDSVQIWRNGQRLQTIQAETFRDQEGFAQTTYSDGGFNGDVHGEEVDGRWQEVGWIIWSQGFVGVNVNLPEDGDYTIRVSAWGTESGDGIEPQMTILLSGLDTQTDTRGAAAIKSQIRSLYKIMLGDDLPETDPEIEAVYALLLEAWEDRRSQENNSSAWHWPVEDCFFQRDILEEDWQAGLGNDPQQMLFSWTSVMHYLLTHFDYLHE